MASEEEAITRRLPSGATNMSPAAPTSSTSTQLSASTVNNSTTSKSTHERVGQLHDRPSKLCFSGHRHLLIPPPRVSSPLVGLGTGTSAAPRGASIERPLMA